MQDSIDVSNVSDDLVKLIEESLEGLENANIPHIIIPILKMNAELARRQDILLGSVVKLTKMYERIDHVVCQQCELKKQCDKFNKSHIMWYKYFHPNVHLTKFRQYYLYFQYMKYH